MIKKTPHPKYSTKKVYIEKKKEQACTTFHTFLYNSLAHRASAKKEQAKQKKQDTKRQPTLPQMRRSCSTWGGKRMADSQKHSPQAPSSDRVFPSCRIVIARIGRWAQASAPLSVARGVHRGDGSAGQSPWGGYSEKSGGYSRLVFEAWLSLFLSSSKVWLVLVLFVWG